MLDSLVCTGMLYNAGTWPRLEAAAEKAFSYALMGLYRMTAGKEYAVGARVVKPDSQVAAAINRPLPGDMMKIARLRYFGRVVLHAPPPLRALLQATVGAPRSWVKLITQDLEWMAQHVHLLKELNNASIDAWENFIMNYLRQEGSRSRSSSQSSECASQNLARQVREHHEDRRDDRQEAQRRHDSHVRGLQPQVCKSDGLAHSHAEGSSRPHCCAKTCCWRTLHRLPQALPHQGQAHSAPRAVKPQVPTRRRPKRGRINGRGNVPSRLGGRCLPQAATWTRQQDQEGHPPRHAAAGPSNLHGP